jgi:hypothetical protein
VSAVVLTIVGFGLNSFGGGSSRSFDHLTDADRDAFQKRFESEIWPLLERGGKDGCVGCHVANHRTMLKFKGKPGEDFHSLLKNGFLLANDSGNLVALIETKDKKRKMPPGNRPAWADKDIRILKQFIADVDDKQMK